MELFAGISSTNKYLIKANPLKCTMGDKMTN